MQEKIYDVPAEWAKRAHIDAAKYRTMYDASINDPDAFWGEHGKRIHWMTPYKRVKNVSFAPGNVSIKWFEDGTTNAAYNCIDRHLPARANQVAIIWEGDDPSESKLITYRELHNEVCRFANVLRNRGVKKGDRVTIYLPMIPEAAYAMLACARLGAIHSVVFGGFSPDALAGRIEGCQSKLVITADEGLRGGRKVPLKANVDTAIERVGGVDQVVVVRRTGGKVAMEPVRDVWYHEAAAKVTTECPCVEMNAEHPLFILYTSGSTGSPKGVLHTTAGYLVYAAMTHQYIFDYHEGDIYWCTADVGWVTGHSYILYGPLANGATTLMFEGVPSYPTNARFWEVIDKHKVNTFYTAPTAIRALMRSRRGNGEEDVAPDAAAARLGGRADQSRGVGMVLPRRRRQTLPDRRHLVADGDRRHPDLALAGGDAVETRFRHHALLRRAAGRWLTPAATCWRAPPKAASSSPIPGRGRCAPCTATTSVSWRPISPPIRTNSSPATAAGATRTATTGSPAASTTSSTCRATAWARPRSKSSLVAHPKVSEAAVVGYPHDIKGQGIYAYVTLMEGEVASEGLRKELVAWVRKDIGPIASPDLIQFAPGLPKTRSGKIMRRILRKIAENEFGALGDTSTLADPAVVDDLIRNR